MLPAASKGLVEHDDVGPQRRDRVAIRTAGRLEAFDPLFLSPESTEGGLGFLQGLQHGLLVPRESRCVARVCRTDLRSDTSRIEEVPPYRTARAPEGRPGFLRR